MRVLVAGATGVIGNRLVPLLESVGHDVIALSRSRPVAAAQATVVADALDRAAVIRAVREAAPDAIVNMLTAIPKQINPKKMAKQFEQTNLLRTVGTANLVAAGQAVGVTRLVAQGLAYAYDPAGAGFADEDAPLWQNPPKQFAGVLTALKELEQRTCDAGGLVVRLGHLYGPGTIYAADGSFVQQVRTGKVPLVGGGTATFSFTHAHDAATAIVATLDRDVSGVLNIVDNNPAKMSEWLPVMADIVGAKQPKSAPAMLAQMAVGGWGVAFMTQLRGADNTRAKTTLDWRPRYASWRTGFSSELERLPAKS